MISYVQPTWRTKTKRMNEAYNCQLALKMAVTLGVSLMENGAEVYRVEESIIRVLKSYGIKRTDVYAIPNILMVTIETDEEISFTKMRRIFHRNPNFEKVIQLNDFARKLSAKPIPLNEAFQCLREIDGLKNYSKPVNWISYLLAAAAFVVMIGGNVGDAIVAILCAAVGRLVCVPMERYHANGFFVTLVTSFLHNIVAFICAEAVVGLHPNIIITGTLMLLFPGVAFMTAIRDVIVKDLSAGMFEGLEAIVVACAIAVGSALAYALVPMIVRVI